MESNDERFRKFKEEIDKEIDERRAYNKLIGNAVTISVCGALLVIIPYLGWLILVLGFCYCCYAFKKTLSGIAILSLIVSALALFLRYIYATTF